MFETLLSSYFVLDYTSSFEIIHTQIDDPQFVQVCVILFLCTITDIITHNAHFSPSLKLFRSCPQLKVVHAYQNFPEQNSKAPSYHSHKKRKENFCFLWLWSYRLIEQIGVPCARRGEGFCYFDCNIF